MQIGDYVLVINNGTLHKWSVLEKLSDGRLKVASDSVLMINGHPENVFIVSPFTAFKIDGVWNNELQKE
jgi:hypothetical protein